MNVSPSSPIRHAKLDYAALHLARAERPMKISCHIPLQVNLRRNVPQYFRMARQMSKLSEINKKQKQY